MLFFFVKYTYPDSPFYLILEFESNVVVNLLTLTAGSANLTEFSSIVTGLSDMSELR